jgi:hypothetical protein
MPKSDTVVGEAMLLWGLLEVVVVRTGFVLERNTSGEVVVAKRMCHSQMLGSLLAHVCACSQCHTSIHVLSHALAYCFLSTTGEHWPIRSAANGDAVLLTLRHSMIEASSETSRSPYSNEIKYA